MFKKWREKDSAKLRQLEREFKSLKHEFSMLMYDYRILRTDYRNLEKRVDAKEVTHIQKVQVELTKPFDYDGWYP